MITPDTAFCEARLENGPHRHDIIHETVVGMFNSGHTAGMARLLRLCLAKPVDRGLLRSTLMSTSPVRNSSMWDRSPELRDAYIDALQALSDGSDS